MQKLLLSVSKFIILLGITAIIIGFDSSAVFVLKETGFILILIMYLLACIPWGIFYYLYKYEPSMTKREVDGYYFVHFFFFIFINLFAYQSSKIIIIASSYYCPSTIITTTVSNKEIKEKSRGRGNSVFVHTITISVPRERLMYLEVTPSFYERVNKGQQLKISSKQTPFADVYSGFYQPQSTILLYE